MKVSFRAVLETWATPPNISCFLNGKVRLWSFQLCIFSKHIWVKNKGTILFTNHFYLGWKEVRLRLTEIPRAVELSGKTALISTKPQPPQSCYLFWIDHHLVGKSSFKCRTEVFSFYIIGEMFKTNKLFVDSVANYSSSTLTAKFSFCVFIFSMTCHDTKENSVLYRFIPDSKTITIICRLFSFLYIIFYWNNNLKLCYSLTDTAVKNR